jgi:hypothetical protein
VAGDDGPQGADQSQNRGPQLKPRGITTSVAAAPPASTAKALGQPSAAVYRNRPVSVRDRHQVALRPCVPLHAAEPAKRRSLAATVSRMAYRRTCDLPNPVAAVPLGRRHGEAQTVHTTWQLAVMSALHGFSSVTD